MTEATNSLRAVVSVSFGEHLEPNRRRLERILASQGERLVIWRGLPPESPSHEDTPYAFKGYALQDAALQGFRALLWVDSSIVPIRSLTPLWEIIESQGYWFSMNLPYGKAGVDPMSTGQWANDASLPLLGITREQAFGIPHLIATSFGLDLRHEIGRSFFDQYLAFAKDGRAFRGPWTNEFHQASGDPRVSGHRHDQTVASVIAWRLGMKLTRPPAWIVDGLTPTSETILEIRR